MAKNKGADGETTAAATAGSGEACVRTVPALMYIGPNRAFGLPVSYNQVFRVSGLDQLPEPLRSTAKSNPDFAACFVPPAGLGLALAELKKGDSVLHKTRNRVAAQSNKMRAAKA